MTNFTNTKHYRDLGYQFKLNDTLVIPVEHLTHASEKRIEVQCDYCGNIFEKTYKEFIKGRQGVIHKDCCSSCQNKKTQESMMKTYGVRNCSRLPEVRKKISEHKRGSKHHNWQSGVSSLNDHLRCIVDPWRIDYLKSKNYTCEITGDSGVVNLHHCFPFHRIARLTLYELKLKPKSIGEYTQEELKSIEELFLKKHKELSQPIVIREDIHKLYHHEFGFFSNTQKQFKYFIGLWLAGEFNG